MSLQTLNRFLFPLGLVLLVAICYLLYLAAQTDLLYSAFVKDPERAIPTRNNIVAVSDGRILYVRRVDQGQVDVMKNGVAIPLAQLTQTQVPERLNGYLIGTFMSVDSVHMQRAPMDSTFLVEEIHNGPYARMGALSRNVFMVQMIPGLTAIKKLLGVPPYDIEGHGDYIVTGSARGTATFRAETGQRVLVIRIADYVVGKLLTWLQDGQQVQKGQRWGFITWGSQTDVFIEDRPGLKVTVGEGDYVNGGQTIIAVY